jgi:hypothetical protein
MGRIPLVRLTFAQDFVSLLQITFYSMYEGNVYQLKPFMTNKKQRRLSGPTFSQEPSRMVYSQGEEKG